MALVGLGFWNLPGTIPSTNEFEEKGGEAAFTLIAGAGMLLYWFVRSFLERLLYEEGAQIRIDGQQIEFPGFLVGRAVPIQVTRMQVLGLKLEYSSGQFTTKPEPERLTLDTTSEWGRLTFWATSIDGDLREVAETMSESMHLTLTVDEPASS